MSEDRVELHHVEVEDFTLTLTCYGSEPVCSPSSIKKAVIAGDLIQLKAADSEAFLQ